MSEVYSYSRLNSFEQCPWAWNRTYNDGIRGLNSCFSEFGSLIHSILERYEKGELAIDRMVDAFEWEFDDAIKSPWMKTKNGTLRDSYYKQGVDFLTNYKFSDVKEILGVEEHFKVPINDWYLQGFIDLIYINNNDNLVIRDWKSGKNWSRDVIEDHAKQPYLYSKYISDKYGKFPDYLEFYSFRENKPHLLKFSEQDYNRSIEWANNQVDKIRSAWSYDKRPDQFFCTNLCGHRDVCVCGKFWWWNEQKNKKRN